MNNRENQEMFTWKIALNLLGKKNTNKKVTSDKFPKKHRFFESKGYFPNDKNGQALIKSLNNVEFLYFRK